jgi:hypothetical protein
VRSFIFLFPLLFICGCRNFSKIPDGFDNGKTENGIYTNNYFGIEVTVPAKWIVQSKAQIDSIFNTGNMILEERNKEPDSDLKKVETKTPILLMAFKYPADSAIAGYNPYFMITAEKFDPLSGIKTGVDYLANERNLMEQAKIGYHVTSDYSIRSIGNKEFDVLGFTKAVGEQMDVKRVYHVRIEKGFALGIMISYASDKKEEELPDMLNKIKFN